jgi:predicted nucleic acid-binding protein
MTVPGREALLDTSFIVALENRDDPAHQRALTVDRMLIADHVTLVTHWGVLLEIGDGYARLGRRQKGIELLARLTEEPGYVIVPIDAALLARATTLYSQRPDKEWGLTDCVSFTLMHDRSITQAVTADEHFAQAGFQALLMN